MVARTGKRWLTNIVLSVRLWILKSTGISLITENGTKVYYQQLAIALLTHIFCPLQQSINSFIAILAPRNENIATCPPGVINLAQFVPNFN